jgi:hypothetical protein
MKGEMERDDDGRRGREVTITPVHRPSLANNFRVSVFFFLLSPGPPFEDFNYYFIHAYVSKFITDHINAPKSSCDERIPR